MKKVKLLFKGVSEIVGSDELGLVILTDEAQTRQITIVCDKHARYQFGIRLSKEKIAETLLPEVLWSIISLNGDNFEIIINNLTDGQYHALLVNTETFDIRKIRASDAVLLSHISKIPIYIEDLLMRNQSVPYSEGTVGMSIPVNALSDDMLEKSLEKAINDEDYELASQLRDEQNRRKRKTNIP